MVGPERQGQEDGDGEDKQDEHVPEEHIVPIVGFALDFHGLCRSGTEDQRRRRGYALNRQQINSMLSLEVCDSVDTAAKALCFGTRPVEQFSKVLVVIHSLSP